MEIKLLKRPHKPIIIEGFPGYGLVGTITTEFLIDHLNSEYIGSIWLPELPATVAVHESKIVQPIGLHYNEEYNIIIVHGITMTKGVEWKIADAISQMAKELEAWEIISLEGVGSTEEKEDPETYYFCTHKDREERVRKACSKPLKEGIIMGVTSALLVKSDIPMTCFFAESHANIPDSKAAARIIETLDKYLGLKVDYKPLIKQAIDFENKVKSLIEKSAEAEKEAEKRTLSYFG
jgi:uncharacterized protein